jgi:hypothetical protein
MNGKWAKDEAVRIWGPIEHPTIDDIAVMILDFWDEVLRDDPAAGWSDLVMWKMDLKGAYTLMDVRPEEAGLFAHKVVDGLIFFYLGGPAHPRAFRSSLGPSYGSSGTSCKARLKCTWTTYSE